MVIAGRKSQLQYSSNSSRKSFEHIFGNENKKVKRNLYRYMYLHMFKY